MEFILFDFGGTLDSDGVPWLDRFHPIYKEEGLDLPREEFARAFYDSDDNLPVRFPLKELSLEQTLKLQVGCVLQALPAGRRPASADAVVERVAGRFLDESRRHFRRNRPVLERLRRRHRLGIVSNFYGNLEAVLASEGLLEFFEVVADSQVVGAEKPAEGIFRYALDRLGGRASEGLMVGDSVPRDMRGAEGLRMSHALIGGAPERRCCPEAWLLKTLPELEPLLS